MNVARVDKIIQFALAVAARADDRRDRELGRIHLVKYLYLADLAYANRHDGETYTGIPWRFYKFGPWDEAVLERIEPATQAVDAEVRTFEWSNDEGDGETARYQLTDPSLFDSLEAGLDEWVASAVKKSVRKFHADTPELLHHVYMTRPMLTAAPHEPLDFTPEAHESFKEPETAALTARQRKKQKQRLEKARKRVQAKLAEVRAKKKGRSPYTPVPRYDDEYFEGLKWLDSLAGEELPEEGELVFSDEIWISRSRFDPDVP